MQVVVEPGCFGFVFDRAEYRVRATLETDRVGPHFRFGPLAALKATPPRSPTIRNSDGEAADERSPIQGHEPEMGCGVCD